MRIAIDATSIPPRPVGVGHYLINLVSNLSTLSLDEEIFIFVHRECVPLFGSILHPRIKFIPIQDKSPFWRIVWEQFRLPWLLQKYHIDVIHSPHYTIPILTRCRRVVTFHDMTFILFPQFHRPSKRIYFKVMMTLSSHLADVLISISENTRQDILKLLKTPQDKVVTIPLGVSDDFHPIQDQSVLERIKKNYLLPDIFFLYVGTLEPRKNITMLLNAYQQYRHQGGNASLILVGQLGWMVDDLIRKLQDPRIESQIRWLGYIPQEDLPGIYNLALGLIYPSYYEGFGLPPLEAMACGTPVITTAIGSLMEIVGEAGMLVPPGDELAMTQAMLKIWSKTDLRQQFRKLGIERAAMYSWQNTAQQTLAIYRQCRK